MVKFSETEAPPNVSQIEDLENLVGLVFPEEYRAHLLRHNGGRCSPNVFIFNERGKWTSSCVDWFLAVYEGDASNLQWMLETFKIEDKRMPSHILPIAHDPGGNLVCISCGERDYGQIYFWDHEREVDYSVSDDSDYKNLYFVARSLTEFLEGLKEMEEI